MDANLLQQREQLRTALSAYGADVKRFQDIDLDKLWNSRYCSVDALQDATREGLTAAGLPPGLVDHISARKGRISSATGLGTEGAAASDNNAISSAPCPAHQGGQQVGASAAPIADAQPPMTMAALREALERQAATMKATVKEALERQAAALERQAATMKATVKEALERQAAALERQAAALERQAATMKATVKEALERQAATMTTTVKEALERQAAALEVTLKGALPDNGAALRFPVSTVDWNQLERDWAVYLTEVPTKTKVS